eukprot:3417990-Amphidinium_carterae.3
MDPDLHLCASCLTPKLLSQHSRLVQQSNFFLETYLFGACFVPIPSLLPYTLPHLTMLSHDGLSAHAVYTTVCSACPSLNHHRREDELSPRHVSKLPLNSVCFAIVAAPTGKYCFGK